MGRLNIRDATLVARAKEPAALPGTTATRRTRPAQERRDREVRAEDRMAIGRHAAARLGPEQRRLNHAGRYDDSGLLR
jgi:hypothetical protein